MEISHTIKNEAKTIVSEYSQIFNELEKLEMMASSLDLQKDLLLSRLDSLRDRERMLIDNIGEVDNKITLNELLS
jgi:predicted  nucleic acid-binding Zn-ribbon protein